MTDESKRMVMQPAPVRKDLNARLASAAQADEAHRRLGRGLADLSVPPGRGGLLKRVMIDSKTLPESVVKRELVNIMHQIEHLIENTTSAELPGDMLEKMADEIRRKAWARQREES